MKTLKINIVTPDGPVLEDEANLIIATTEQGELGVLPGHIAMVAPLQIGGLRITKDDKTEVVAVNGGFMEVRPDGVTILAQSAETAGSIDLARAKIAEQRAKEFLAQKKDSLEAQLAELALKRAINRIRIGENEKDMN